MGVALSNNSAAVQQITSILNIFAHNVAGPNGTVLPAQAQVQAAIANITSGFSISEATYEGSWSVSNPGAWPAPTPTSTQIQSIRSKLELLTFAEKDPALDPVAYREVLKQKIDLEDHLSSLLVDSLFE